MGRYCTATLMTPSFRDETECWPRLRVECEDGSTQVLNREWAVKAMRRYFAQYKNYIQVNKPQCGPPIPPPTESTEVEVVVAPSGPFQVASAPPGSGSGMIGVDWTQDSPFDTTLCTAENRSLGDRLGRERPATHEPVDVDEMHAYMSESFPVGRFGGDDKRDPLEYWAQQCISKPLMAFMAREVFAGPPTSAGVERVFSRVGRYRSKLQRRVKESTLQMYAFVAVNSKLISTCRALGLIDEYASI
eukprot:GHVU01030172.1.p1 GENE.GHVU01030172.1~~GHVU01030172.1.p1  ORF type:complete len:246 (+),score=18.27 GHVU01030172.1:100-837(+)